MRFDVAYWLPKQYSVIAEEEDVIAALGDYAYNGKTRDEDTARAQAALDAIQAGREPGDLDVIADALREYQFTAPGEAEPDKTDEADDYMVEIRHG